MKKLLAILLGACLLLGVMSGCGGEAEDAVTVQKVSDITSQGSVGLVNRYAGLVVSGETATVKKGDKNNSDCFLRKKCYIGIYKIHRRKRRYPRYDLQRTVSEIHRRVHRVR